MARIIPVLLIKDYQLVKTTRYRSASYVGCPKNAVKMFTEFRAEELIILGIDRRRKDRYFKSCYLARLGYDAQMPLAYGGGIRSLDDAKSVLDSGFEKVILNTALFKNPSLIDQIASTYGSQAVVASIDYRFRKGQPMVFIEHGSKCTRKTLQSAVLDAVSHGAGELLLSDIEREGSWSGYDIETIKSISNICSVPLVINGGCGSTNDIQVAHAINDTSTAVGSMALFIRKAQGVLLNYPILP